MSLRVFAGGVVTETNTFSPIPTGVSDFTVVPPHASPAMRAQLLYGSTIDAYAGVAAKLDCVLVAGSFAAAQPAGLMSAATYGSLRERVLQEIAAALPLDAVVMTLHGAMTASGVTDCESDLLTAVRALVGPNVAIGSLLDLHCDLPDELVQVADVLVTFKEYPHVDVDVRARELMRLVVNTARGTIRPVMATWDCRMVGGCPTTSPAMKAFVADVLHGTEREPDVLSASLAHGFPYSDCIAAGARTLVVTDGDAPAAAAHAARIGTTYFALREEVLLHALPIEEALDRAAATAGTVVLADAADNPGGGAAGDSTFLLEELLRRGTTSVGIAPLWDPVAVQVASSAGPGARLRMRLGGKVGPASGQPVDVEVEVLGVIERLIQRWPQTSGAVDVDLGAAACLRCPGEIDVVVASRRDQAFGTELFTAFGLNPRDKRLLVLKSTNHFAAAYAPLAAAILHVDTPGTLPADPRALAFLQAPVGRLYPWNPDPHEIS